MSLPEIPENSFTNAIASYTWSIIWLCARFSAHCSAHFPSCCLLTPKTSPKDRRCKLIVDTLAGFLNDFNVCFVSPWVARLVSNKAHRDYPAVLHRFLTHPYEGQLQVLALLQPFFFFFFLNHAYFGRKEALVFGMQWLDGIKGALYQGEAVGDHELRAGCNVAIRYIRIRYCTRPQVRCTDQDMLQPHSTSASMNCNGMLGGLWSFHPKPRYFVCVPNMGTFNKGYNFKESHLTPRLLARQSSCSQSCSNVSCCFQSLQEKARLWDP